MSMRATQIHPGVTFVGSFSSRSRLIRQPAMRNKQKSFDGYPSKPRTSSGDTVSRPVKTCPYNPDEPLIMSPKMVLEDQHSSPAWSRKFTIVGPLVQDVCKKLNIPHEECLDTSVKVTYEMMNKHSTATYCMLQHYSGAELKPRNLLVFWFKDVNEPRKGQEINYLHGHI